MLLIPFYTATALGLATAHPAPDPDHSGLHHRSGHQFTLTNKCGNSVQPVIANTRCGFSPRCSNAVDYSGPQPHSLGPGSSQTLTIDSTWVGRIFVQSGACGAKGDGCSMAEFNLDKGDHFTPQSYDISSIQGFTQSMQISGNGCAVATCTNANCGCTNAFPIGDMGGCGNDLPVKGCGAGDLGFNVVFCP